ncbi:MAG: glycogen-binding domain-containing protein, partial [Longimicrobiales bacterium]
FELSAGWKTTGIELDATAGHRAGERLPVLGGTDKTWGSVNVVAWVKPWAGLVAGAGTYPVDLTQGFPGGHFVTLGARFRASPRKQVMPAPIVQNGEALAATGAITAFEAVPSLNGFTTLRIRAPGAAGVEIMGDFTDWQPLSLKPGGWWTATLRIKPGTHQMNARINGGDWFVPPGLSVLKDEFGGSVGILIVPR